MACTEHDHSVPPVVPTSAEQNLISYIDQSAVKILNGAFKPQNKTAVTAENVGNILVDETEDKYLESDCDCQLIIQINFIQPVKLYSVLIDMNASESHIKHIHLYKNQISNNVNFDKLQTTKFDFSIECRNDDLSLGLGSLQEYHVPRPLFKNIKSVVLFMPDNLQNDEDLITRVNCLQFRGAPVNASQYQAQDFTLKGQVFESAPSLNDHVKLDEGSNSMLL